MEEKKQYNFLPDWVTTKNEERIKIEGEVSLVNPHASSVFNGIIEYCEKYHTSYLPLEGLIKHLLDYGMKINDPTLKSQNSIMEVVKPVYTLLLRNKYCLPEIVDKKVVAIIIRDPKAPTEEDIKNIKESLKKEYERCATEEKRPFPSILGYQNFHFYPDILYVISLKEYVERLSENVNISFPFCKILLPENFDIFLPSEFFSHIYKISLAKIQLHLSFSENSRLIFNRLKERFSSFKVMKEFKEAFPLEKQSSEILASISTEIMGYIQNIEKDLALWQSCQIIQAMAYKEGVDTQKKLLSKDAFSIFLKVAEKIPSFFNRSIILKLRDNYTNLKIFTLEDYTKLVDEFLSKYSSRDASQPLIATKFHNEKIYIYRNNFYKSLMSFLDKAFFDIHKEFFSEYTHRAKLFLKQPYMRDENSFEEYVKKRLFSENSFMVYFLKEPSSLYSILGYSERNLPEAKNCLNRFFYKKGESIVLKPFSIILDLPYENVVKEAKLYLPFFEQVNIIEFILSFFKKFGGFFGKALDSQLKARKELPALNEIMKPLVVKGKTNKPASAIPKVETKKKPKSFPGLEDMKKEMIGNSTLEEVLALYESRWNHVINKDTRAGNLNYVKNRIASRLRFISKPSPEKILQEVNDIILTDKKLQEITDQDSLKKYITLVIIEYFLKKK
ncbi:MAG: hypothetical protein ACP5QT_03950 [Brevinematia bacterium]